MSPNQTIRVNFWLPVLGVIASGALSAGLAYGIIGANVTRNTDDIAELQAKRDAAGGTITDILVSQGTLVSRFDALSDRMDTVTRILEREYGGKK